MKRYKFAEPLEEKDEHLVFEVLQERGDRVLVRELTMFNDCTYPPVFVYFKSELVEISD